VKEDGDFAWTGSHDFTGATVSGISGGGGVPTTRQIIAGAGLTGGGDLSADRTLDVGAGTGISVGANSVSVDTSVIQAKSEKGAASGYASLDGSTLVPTAELGTGSASSSTVLRGDRTWATVASISVGLAVYGDGSDGDLAIAAGTTTHTRANYFDDLDIDAGAVLAPDAYITHVKGALTLDGTIRFNGNNSTGFAGGAAPGGNQLGLGGVGGNGNTGAGSNGAGANCASTSGGAGGAGASGAGGTGTANAPVAGSGGVRSLHCAVTGYLPSAPTTRFNYGAGGGGGGGDGVNRGGGGGSGGPGIHVLAKTISGSGAIEAKGGNGRTPTVGNCGGGGGGGGGGIFLVYNSKTGITTDVSGGVKGNGVGTGANGSDGSTGVVIEFANAA
jgi:hypothetical protein